MGRPTRATSSVVAVVLLVGVAVLTAALVGSATLAATPDGAVDVSRVRLAASADATTDRVTLTHRGGDTLAVDDLRVVVSVDGQRLAYQPPVPFFAARGFRAGPTGPFNVATDDRWRAGETAGFRVAGTNSPGIDSGSQVRVVLYRGESRVGMVETRAG